MGNEVGLPNVEVRFLIEGTEVAVVAFFITERRGVDVIVGVDDPEYASHIARTIEGAALAIRNADWKSVSLGGDETVPFSLKGYEDYAYRRSPDNTEQGGTPSETEYPF